MNYKNIIIEAAINRYRKGKMPSNGNWSAYHKSFRNVELTPYDLAVHIWQGYAFAPPFEGRRKKYNFSQCWHVALDFDTCNEHSDIDKLKTHTLIRDFASFLYATPSSKPEAPKSRVVFVLGHPFTDLEKYETLYRAFLYQFPHADQQTKDCLRLFYGSQDCRVEGVWQMLPHEVAEYLIKEYEANKPPPPPKKEYVVVGGSGNRERYVKAAIEGELLTIKQAVNGHRNVTLFKAAASIGELVGASWAGLSYGEAETALTSAASRWQDMKEEARKTIRSGLETGQETPRDEPQTKYKAGLNL